MADLRTRAELIKIAREIGTTPDQVQFLERLGADDLTDLRQRLSGRMFEGDRVRFSRAAEVVKLIPALIAAKLAAIAVRPFLAARVASLAPPKKAGAIASHMPISYLASGAPHFDPRAAKSILSHVPPKTCVQAGLAVLAVKDFITLGRLVDAVTDETLEMMEEAITDDEAMVQIAFYVEDPLVLDRVIKFFSDERLRRIANVAMTGPVEGRLAALYLMTRVSDTVKRQLGDIAADQPDEAITGLVHTAREEDALGEMLISSAAMSPPKMEKVLRLPVFTEPGVLEGVVGTTAERGLWYEAITALQYMPGPLQTRSIEILLGMGEQAVAGLAEGATRHGLWPVLLPILAAQDRKVQKRLAGSWANIDETARITIEKTAEELGLRDDLKALLATVSVR